MKTYYYEVSCLSNLFINNPKKIIIASAIQLNEGTDIVVEKSNQGFFLARIIGEVITDYDVETIYSFVQVIDLSKRYAELENAKKIIQLEEEITRRIEFLKKQQLYKDYGINR